MRATFFAVIYIWVQLQTLVQEISAENTTKNEAQDSSRRVVFGRAADVSDFPYLVILHMGITMCGGSIIADQWILSVTHCIINMHCRSIKIEVAVWESGKIINPIKCYTHPQFNSVRWTNDISLLKMQESLLEDGRTRVIPLPKPGSDYSRGIPGTVVGWGETEYGVYPSQLVFVDVITKDWESCNEAVKKIACLGNRECISNVPDIPGKTVCIVGDEGSDSREPSESCDGGAGGPFVINGILVGVFSHFISNGVTRCPIGLPSMCTNVVDYLPWISKFVTPDVDTREMEV